MNHYPIQDSPHKYQPVQKDLNQPCTQSDDTQVYSIQKKTNNKYTTLKLIDKIGPVGSQYDTVHRNT